MLQFEFFSEKHSKEREKKKNKITSQDPLSVAGMLLVNQV